MAPSRIVLRVAKTLAAALAAVLSPDAPAAAQSPEDTARVRQDTAVAPVYAVSGLLVSVPRPIATTGGASAVAVKLDSLAVGPAPTLEQVLRRLPLVQVRTNSRGEAQPALRGAEDRQLAVLVDGIPITLGWDHRTDLSIVPLTAAREVRLVRGLASLLHGPNVLGGVVDIDVARPAAAAPPLAASLSVDQTGGRSASVSAAGAAGGWRYRGGGGYRQRAGVPLPDIAPAACPADAGAAAPCGARQRALLGESLRLNSDLRQLDGFLSGGYRDDSGRWLSFLASGLRSERGVPPEAHTSDPRLWRYPLQTRLLSALTLGTGERSTPLGAGDLELSLGADVGRTVIDEFASVAYDSVVGGETDRDRTLTARLVGDHTLGAAGELRSALTYADVFHHEILRPGGPADYRQRLWSAGVEVERRLAPLPGVSAVRATVGLALDGADTPLSGDKPPLGSLTDWGGRIGVTATTARGALLFHGAVSRRARFPSLRELYSGALGRFEPNPALRPEVLTAAEAGMTASLGASELQAVAFHHRLSNAIVRTRVDVAGASKLKRVNRDRIHSTGLELLGALAGPAGTALTGDLTLQRVRVSEPAAGVGGEPEYEPAVAGRLALGVPLGRRLEASGEARYVGRQYCVDPDSDGTRPLRARTTLDAALRGLFRAGRGALSRLAAVLSVDNLADTTAYDQCGLPGPGRTLRLQLRIG